MAATLNGPTEDGRATPESQQQAYLDALSAELVGYERSGKGDRAKEVKAEIARVTKALPKVVEPEATEDAAQATADAEQAVAEKPAKKKA